MKNTLDNQKQLLGAGILGSVERRRRKQVAVRQPSIFYPGQKVEVYRDSGQTMIYVGSFKIGEIDEGKRTLRSEDLPAGIRKGDFISVA